MNSTSFHTSDKRTKTNAITIIAGMFFIFSFVSWVNAMLNPYFKIFCELTNSQSHF